MTTQEAIVIPRGSFTYRFLRFFCGEDDLPKTRLGVWGTLARLSMNLLYTAMGIGLIAYVGVKAFERGGWKGFLIILMALMLVAVFEALVWLWELRRVWEAAKSRSPFIREKLLRPVSYG